jgi:hypothetical protein
LFEIRPLVFDQLQGRGLEHVQRLNVDVAVRDQVGLELSQGAGPADIRNGEQ